MHSAQVSSAGRTSLQDGMGNFEQVYPDLDELAKRVQRQSNAPFLDWLPLELRMCIYKEVWRGVGLAQHILMVQDNRLTHAPCTTNHSAPDDRQDACAKLDVNGDVEFEDRTWGRRLHSPWGNHWKCREDRFRPKANNASPFLPMLLTCRQLYLECRKDIYDTLTFMFHNVQTLHYITVERRQHILDSIKFLNLSIMLPIIPKKAGMNTRARVTISQWREACIALANCRALTSVNIWLDITDIDHRHLLSSVPEVNPFIFDQKLASILTVNIPADPDTPEVWQEIASIEPSFTILARGWPLYVSENFNEHEIMRLDDDDKLGNSAPLSTNRGIAPAMEACGRGDTPRQRRIH